MFTKNFLKYLAKTEKVPLSFLEKKLKAGEAVIPLNRKRKTNKPVVIGDGFKVKINANIGASPRCVSLQEELKKVDVAVCAGADSIMDLSVAGDLRKIRKAVISHSPVAVGTVPIYEIAVDVKERKGDFNKINFEDILSVLQAQAEDGVDFFTIHAGILKKAVDYMRHNKRTGGIVSRGGAIMAGWMHANKKENPFYENFDKILNLARDYNVAISLGDALRPGAIADSNDKAQVDELRVLGQLVKRCRRSGVQAMVEGPGHIRLDRIAESMIMQKKICFKAPFYVLGPLPTDIAAGYDHITSAIGSAFAAFYGANFLCVVTPAEHLSHPSIDDIKDGVMAARIAAHCVDLLRFKDEWEKDRRLSFYRCRRDWDKMFSLLMDEKKARSYRENASKGSTGDSCSMCGEFCSLKIADKCGLLK